MTTICGRSFLITGGTGFIGSALVKALLKAGARVRVLDNNSRGSREKLGEAAKDVEIMEGDIRDPEVVRRAVRGVESVYHLAAVNGTEYFYSKPEFVLEVAVKGIVNVIDACLAEGVRDFGLASTSEVYQTPSVVPTPETVPLIVPDPLNARYSYAGGKIVSELMAINYGRKHFERVVIFRPHNVYGPNMGWEHVIPQLIKRLEGLAEKKSAGPILLPIQGTGQESRSFVYIDDMIDGILELMEKGKHLEIYHIGTEDEVTVENLAKEIGKQFGLAVEVSPGALSPGGTLRRCPNISKMRALGYAPKISLTEGLGRTVHWYRNQLRPLTQKES
jgi:nucleoside-diphosphate-sugar epimerase